jgi:hypothetical protein
MFINQRSNNLTVSKPGQKSLVQQERTAKRADRPQFTKRADRPQFIKPPDLPQKMLPNYWRFQVRVLAAVSNIKYQEYVQLIVWPNCHLQPWNIWDPDINYPAPIPIIVHAYILLTLSSACPLLPAGDQPLHAPYTTVKVQPHRCVHARNRRANDAPQ